jgi:predicted  nucleic acid-binding Zn-ribbon protein
MQLLKAIFFVTISSTLLSCQSSINNAVKDTKYSVYEFFGVEKRDLFKKKIKNTKDDQQSAAESFQSALDKLQAIYKFDGGNLEKQYRSLDASYNTAKTKADTVHSSIKEVETVAKDLFTEWEGEINQMTSLDLQARSRKTLVDTQAKYQEFHTSLKKSESKMDPVLSKLKDHVLFLKHNLNAKAITGLKTESGKIQGDIESLMKEMNSSITQADEFIKSM